MVAQGTPQQNLYFDAVGSGYVVRYGLKHTLVLNPATEQYVLTYPDGTVILFDSGNGAFEKQINPGGDVITVTGYVGNGFNVSQIQRSYTANGQTTVEQLSYTYSNSSGDYLLSNVTLARSVNGGTFTNVTAANYTYYGYQEPNGGEEDLETVTTQVWSGTAWQNTGTTYYRYYPWFLTGNSSSSSSSGSSSSGSSTVNPLNHLLEYVLNPASYDRMVAAGFNPLTATNAQLSLFADFYFQYDSLRRVTLETVLSGSQTYQYAYTQSSFTSGYNSWSTKTVETRPDGSQNIVYSNFAGQTMLNVLQSGSSQWIEFWQFDSSGHPILHAHPSAVNGFNDTHADLLNFNSSTGTYQYLNNNIGLIETSTYDPCSGYVSNNSLQQGQVGTSIKLVDYAYVCCTPASTASSSSSSGRGSSSSSASSLRSSSSSGSSSSLSCPCSSNIYFLSQITQYPSSTNQTQTIVTRYAYSFYSGTCAVQQRVTTWPVISTAQNGSGVAATRADYFDIYGNLIWKMDERGFITMTVFDISSGAVSQIVNDVNTSMYTNVPTGWSTPSSGGLNLLTDYLFDSQGRMTQSLGPTNTIDINGTATTLRRAEWIYYDDPNHVTYSGQGYANGLSPGYTYFLINPVFITVMDAGGKVLQKVQAASTTTSGSLPFIITSAGSGPAAFPQTTFTRWTTTQYTDCCLRASQSVYKLIPASGSGSSGTNYDQTVFGYDPLKRLVQTTSPGGTITWNVLDPRGLVLATYIGTNDTGGTYTDPTGGGAPGNNMVLVETSVYDGGIAGGDGNRTIVIHQVDSAPPRTATMIYDFRDRLIATDGEIDFYQVKYYDNLDRPTKVERYNTIGPYAGSSSSNSSSSSSSTIGNLIARSVTNFDDRSRVFQSMIYGVDPTTGIVGNALADGFWFDASGNTIKSLPAGSQMFTKTTYDSLERPTLQYRAYGPDSTYADANSVTNNTVMEQLESLFDSENNPIQTTTRMRYHNAVASQTGPLQNPGTTPNARVTYVATYPDAIGRALNVADYGTNGGTSLTRLSTCPARSGTILVNSTAYDNAGNLSIATDPDGTQTCYSYDAIGRKVTVTLNCTGSSSSSSSSSASLSSGSSSSSSSKSACSQSDDKNVVTEYTYTSDGMQATMTAVNFNTGNQTTTWTYGTTLSNSQIASSQLLLSITYPDSAGGSDVVFYSYNRQGEKINLTDQRGCVHTYLYDSLGRQLHDCVTTLGTGVDGMIRRLSTAYEVRGMANKKTSYDDATVGAGSVVNDCEFAFNSFSQLVADYQSHTGAVNTSTTPKVQYGYANGSANTIRPTTLTGAIHSAPEK